MNFLATPSFFSRNLLLPLNYFFSKFKEIPSTVLAKSWGALASIFRPLGQSCPERVGVGGRILARPQDLS